MLITRIFIIIYSTCTKRPVALNWTERVWLDVLLMFETIVYWIRMLTHTCMQEGKWWMIINFKVSPVRFCLQGFALCYTTVFRRLLFLDTVVMALWQFLSIIVTIPSSDKVLNFKELHSRMNKIAITFFSFKLFCSCMCRLLKTIEISIRPNS